MPRMTYSEKFKDPRWQKMRLQVLERCQWKCIQCHDKASTLHVHHVYYMAGRDPWEYPSASMVALCAKCHEQDPNAGAWDIEEMYLLSERFDDCDPSMGEPFSQVSMRTDDILSPLSTWAWMNASTIFGRAMEASCAGVDPSELCAAFEAMLKEKFGFAQDRWAVRRDAMRKEVDA